MFLCALTMFYPGFIQMPFQPPGEYTAQYCNMLGAVNLFVPHVFAVQTDCRRAKSVERGYTNGDLCARVETKKLNINAHKKEDILIKLLIYPLQILAIYTQ